VKLQHPTELLSTDPLMYIHIPMGDPALILNCTKYLDDE
jgi:hypothetical protein